MPTLFPRWMNALPTIMAGGALTTMVIVGAGVWNYFTPEFWEVGYMPTQPGSGFNHQIHAGKLGLDCRYCHTNVEKAWDANIPSVSTCYGCHGPNKLDPVKVSEDKTQFIRDAYESGKPIVWTKVHVVPDYVTFPHAVHVGAGVSCFSCHGQIAGMPVVVQAKSLSMSFCLDCHRDPSKNLVPRDKVTDLVWLENEWFSKDPADRSYQGLTPESLADSLMRNPPTHCAACHF